jgi:uncharacterized phage infection (PIP) family protein YhgE
MASSSQIPRIVLSAAIILTVAAGAKSYMNGGALKKAREDVVTIQATTAAQVAQAKKSIDEAKAAKDELATVVQAKATFEAKANGSAAEIAKAKQQVQEDQNQIQAKDAELADLKKKVADASAAPVPVTPAQDPELLKKVADAEAKAAEKEQLLKAFQSKAEDAEKKASSLEADAARRAAGLARPGLEGRILAVNPNWNFVVLSIGDKQGVVSGASLIVKRGGSLVAKLKVTSVEPSTSIADIQANAAKGAVVQPGDVVIFPGS